MSHQTEIVKSTQTTDTTIEVVIRCCKNPKTDSPLTIHNPHKLTPEQIEAEIVKHHDRVAGKCSGMGKARKHLDSLVTRSKVHGAK